MRWPGPDRRWLLPAVLFGLALGARLLFVSSAPYGDEAHHFYVARHFGAPPANVSPSEDTHWLFWWRPLFSLALVPGALLSFTAFRVDSMVLCSALAPLLFAWVRQRGGRPWAATAAGALVALHPYFVVWGVRVFPDELMAMWFMAGLVAWEAGAARVAAVLFLVSEWTKETAVVGVVALLAWEVARTVRFDAGALVARLRERHVLLVAVAAASWVPHWFAESIGGRAPGWSRGGTLAPLGEQGIVVAWALPLLVAACWVPRARLPLALASAYLAFYGLYHAVRGGAIEQWYLVLPATLSLAAMGLVPGPSNVPRPGAFRRSVAATRRVALLVAAVGLLMQVMVPAGTAAKAPLTPWSGEPEPSALEAARWERTRDRDLWRALDAIPADWRDRVFLMDPLWFHVLYPFSERAGSVRYAYDEGFHGDPSLWVDEIENRSQVTVVHVAPFPVNEAARSAYAACVTFASPEYVVIAGPFCRGHGPAFRADLERRWAQEGP